MSEPNDFQPKIIAYVCNWCTYLGADLAGTNRLEYPANVRIIRLPCTGRIDFNLIIKAFEIGRRRRAGLRLPSGRLPLHGRQLPRPAALDALPPTAGNAGHRHRPHAFLLDFGRRREEVAASHHARSPTRPANSARTRPTGRFARPSVDEPCKTNCGKHAGDCSQDGTVQVVIGYGQAAAGDRVVPVFITRPEDADQLVWNDQCFANLTKYLLRKEVASLGKAAICVKGCDERALVVLEKESQIDRSQIVVIGLACDGVGQPRLAEVRVVRRAHAAAGRHRRSAKRRPTTAPCRPTRRYAELEAFLKRRPTSAWPTGSRTEPLREVLRLPAGLPDVLLPAVHRRKNRPVVDQHLGHAQGQLRLAHHPGVPPGRPLRRLRRMHAGLPGGHRPAAVEPVAGQGGGRAVSTSAPAWTRPPSRSSAPIPSKTTRSSSDERASHRNGPAPIGRRWLAEGKRVAGPQCVSRRPHRSDLIQYAWLASADQLLLDGFIRPANSIKEFVFPRHEKLYGYRFKGKQIELLPVELPTTEQIIIGARPCDAAALPILDRVFNWDFARRVLQPPPRVDHRRDAGLPRVRRPLLLHVGRLGPRRHARLGRAADCRSTASSYEVRCLTEKGQPAVRRRHDRIVRAEAQVIARPAGAVRSGRRGRVPRRRLRTARRGRPPRCAASAAGPAPTLARRATASTSSTKATPSGGVRVRNWDACQFAMFTAHASGHNPRSDQGQRQRQRIYHKFQIYPEKFGELLCTGCGNCTRNCPVGLGVLPVLQRRSTK